VLRIRIAATDFKDERLRAAITHDESTSKTLVLDKTGGKSSNGVDRKLIYHNSVVTIVFFLC